MGFKYEVVTWDWKAQPDLEWLDELLVKFEKPALIPVDTYGDSYAIVICERGTSEEVAQKAFELWSMTQD